MENNEITFIIAVVLAVMNIVPYFLRLYYGPPKHQDFCTNCSCDDCIDANEELDRYGKYERLRLRKERVDKFPNLLEDEHRQKRAEKIPPRPNPPRVRLPNVAPKENMELEPLPEKIKYDPKDWV